MTSSFCFYIYLFLLERQWPPQSLEYESNLNKDFLPTYFRSCACHPCRKWCRNMLCIANNNVDQTKKGTSRMWQDPHCESCVETVGETLNLSAEGARFVGQGRPTIEINALVCSTRFSPKSVIFHFFFRTSAINRNTCQKGHRQNPLVQNERRTAPTKQLISRFRSRLRHH